MGGSSIKIWRGWRLFLLNATRPENWCGNNGSGPNSHCFQTIGDDHQSKSRVYVPNFRNPAIESEMTIIPQQNATTFDSQEMIRGISLAATLANRGALWRTSPADLPQEKRAELWNKTKRVGHYDAWIFVVLLNVLLWFWNYPVCWFCRDFSFYIEKK